MSIFTSAGYALAYRVVAVVAHLTDQFSAVAYFPDGTRTATASFDSAVRIWNDTAFRVGSTTKAMTSALVASLVDDGVLDFGTRSVDIDPAFSLPTAELTNSATVGQLMGMGTGPAEPPTYWWASRSGMAVARMRRMVVRLIGKTRLFGAVLLEFLGAQFLACGGSTADSSALGGIGGADGSLISGGSGVERGGTSGTTLAQATPTTSTSERGQTYGGTTANTPSDTTNAGTAIGSSTTPIGMGGAAPGGTPPDCILSKPNINWANWKMPNPATTGLPNSASYANLGNGTVRDDVTGLVWQHDTAERTFTWQEAKDYCQRLTLAESTWHLPTRIELVSLIDFTVASPGPTIDVDAFPDTAGEQYWSASPVAKLDSTAWLVNFSNSTVDYDGVTSRAHRVRCVQDLAVTNSSSCHYLVSGAETFDTQTGLVWEKSAHENRRTWSEAMTYCATLSRGGPMWRVPSIKELLTIVDESSADPAFEQTLFGEYSGDAFYPCFWSSTPIAGSTSTAWYVYFAVGYPGEGTDSTKFRVRCVH